MKTSFLLRAGVAVAALMTSALVANAADLPRGPYKAPAYIAPRFETGDERYAWLNGVQAVGKGELDGHHLVHDVHEVR